MRPGFVAAAPQTRPPIPTSLHGRCRGDRTHLRQGDARQVVIDDIVDDYSYRKLGVPAPANTLSVPLEAQAGRLAWPTAR